MKRAPSSSSELRERRHRPGRAAADVGVMAARADVEQDLAAGAVEHGRDDRDVRQVRAAVVRIVDHVGVAGLHAAGVLADHRLDRLAHRAEVHRHVRRVGDQVALGVEQRAREVEPLLDVDGVGGVLQPHAHLLGDRHEEVVEHLQHHRVDVGADRQRASAAAGCASARGGRAAVTRACQPGSTTVVAFASAMIAGPSMRVARARVVAPEHRRVVRFVLAEHGHPRGRLQRARCAAAAARAARPPRRRHRSPRPMPPRSPARVRPSGTSSASGTPCRTRACIASSVPAATISAVSVPS